MLYVESKNCVWLQFCLQEMWTILKNKEHTKKRGDAPLDQSGYKKVTQLVQEAAKKIIYGNCFGILSHKK